MCALFDEKRVFISEQDGNVIPRGRWVRLLHGSLKCI
jgi:hypothetical protein